MGSYFFRKTSFLSALLGEMFPSSAQGEVHRNSNDIAYHNQQPWILNDTLLENIIFGKEYDEKRFAVAVEASCLRPDIEMLPAGIMTEIGEKGINLSGYAMQIMLIHMLCHVPLIQILKLQVFLLKFDLHSLVYLHQS